MGKVKKESPTPYRQSFLVHNDSNDASPIRACVISSLRCQKASLDLSAVLKIHTQHTLLATVTKSVLSTINTYTGVVYATCTSTLVQI